MRYSTRYLVIIAFIAALATVLMWFQIPLLPAAPFLEYDLSDIPVLVGTFSLGPVAGIFIATIKALVFLFTKGKSGLIGAFMNLASTISFVVIAGLVYFKGKKTQTSAVIGLILGTITMTAAMVLVNIYIALPIWGIPADQIKPLVYAAIIPFNALRGIISSVMAFLFYIVASTP